MAEKHPLGGFQLPEAAIAKFAQARGITLEEATRAANDLTQGNDRVSRLLRDYGDQQLDSETERDAARALRCTPHDIRKYQQLLRTERAHLNAAVEARLKQR